MSDAPDDTPPEGPRADELEGHHAHAVEFVLERGVGISVYVHGVLPWLSWEETKDLAAWLNEQIKLSEEEEA